MLQASLAGGRHPSTGVLRAVILSAFLAAFVLFVSTATAQSSRSADTARLINEYRASLGLPQLRIDARLAAAAQSHSDFMLANGCFSHICPGEPVPGQRALSAGYTSSGVGEVIGMGYVMPADVVTGWRNSPAHDAILRGQWQDIGCGVAGEPGQVGGGQGPYWTCVVGNPGAPPWPGLPTLPPPGVTLTPRPTTTPTPDPRGPLPAGWQMYTFVPLSLLNMTPPLSDCRRPGTTCYVAIVTDYDADRYNWPTTDYLYYTYCVGLRPRGAWCKWSVK